MPKQRKGSRNSKIENTAKFKIIGVIVKILLVVIILECTVFNIRHWATVGVSPIIDARQHEITLSNIALSPQEANPTFQPIVRDAEITISGVNENIRTVYIQPNFCESTIRMIDVAIRHRDENNVHTHTAQLINGYEPSFHIPLGAKGNVESLTLVLRNEHIGIQTISFNEPLPWRFQWVRVILLTLLVSLICFWRKYQFSKILFNPQLRWQRVLDISVLSIFVGLLFFTMIFSVNFGWIPNSGSPLNWDWVNSQSINSRMVDALLMGQLHLDLEVHESLLNATQPHSPTYRAENNVQARWDHVFFEGRYFSYFGVVPVLILYLPFYWITGAYLSDTVGVFIFSALGAIGIYFLWKELVQKYLQNSTYSVYLAGMVCALFGTNLLSLTVRAHKYEAAITSAFMLAVWGLLFILRSTRDIDKVNRVFLSFGAAFMALAVGCRPTAIFYSLLVPVVLWPVLSRHLPIKKMISNKPVFRELCINFIALALPYMVIGLGLMWYNYARFGSVSEFGANYQITAENVAVLTNTGILGTLQRAFDGLFSYLFAGITLRPHFPFIIAHNSQSVFAGHFARNATVGVFNLPIIWFIFTAFFTRKDSETKAIPIITALSMIGLAIAVASAVLIGVLGRYTVDFFWLLILPSVLCMGFVCKKSLEYGDVVASAVRRISFVAVGISCFVMFAWGMIGENNLIWQNNPVVIRFISDLFMIF